MALEKTFTIPESFEEDHHSPLTSAASQKHDSSNPEHNVTMRTHASLSTLRRLTKGAMSFVSGMLDEKALLYKLELSLYEACSNVVRHAYPVSQQGDLKLSVEICPMKHVTFEITDWGKGFANYPVTLQTPLPEEEDGRGLLIVRGLADCLSICKKDNATVLRMRFHIEEDRWKKCEL